MDPQRREWFDRLFEEAVMMPREQQPDFLAERCPDPALREELRSLLAFATERPVLSIEEAIASAAASLDEDSLAGHRLGPYRLTGRIGVGGMGAVYRAVRDDDQFQKTVAIKMLRFAHSDSHEVERFRRERQILATLEHPNIARLLDGGTWIPPGTDAKQPYLAMEYVEGAPLTQYCEQNQLSVRQRLELFRPVCAAVSYAHQHLIVHRDIKPANVLVTKDGTPKLVDFGIAKLLDSGSGPGNVTATAIGLRAMTPDYASPEQVRGEPVSTLSDVYSLGALLYETLTGHRPHRFTEHDPLQIARAVCENEVELPSIRGGRELRGDIDVIVLRAMQKEAGRRYHSAEQLSEDIRRSLERLPIMAQPDTLFYRARKFVRRHRVGMAAVAVVFLVLVGAVVVSMREARRADSEAAAAKAVNEFLRNDLLAQAGASTQSGPYTKPDPDLKVRTALERASARIQGKFEKQPLLEASIRHTIGDAYRDLGLYPEAQREVERAVELRRRLRGEQDRDTLQSMYGAGELYFNQGKYAQAEATFRRTLENQRRLLGAGHPDTLNTMTYLASAYRRLGKYTDAEPLLKNALEGQKRVLGEKHTDTAATMNGLGFLYLMEGRYAQAEPLYTRSLEIFRELNGEEHPNTLTAMNNLAALYWHEDKRDQAAPLYIRVLETKRRVLGDEHPDTLVGMSNLAALYRDDGKYTQAEALFTTSQAVRLRTLGEDHPLTLDGVQILAQLYRSEGRYSEAKALFTRNLASRRRVQGQEHPGPVNVMYDLAELSRLEREYARAEQLCSAVVDFRRRLLGSQHRDTINALALLGRIRVEEQKYAAAEPVLREALTGFDKASINDWRRNLAQSLLGASLAGQKNYAEAEPLLLAGYRGLLEREAAIYADTRSVIPQARERIVRLYVDWGKPQEVVAWRTKQPGKPNQRP